MVGSQVAVSMTFIQLSTSKLLFPVARSLIALLVYCHYQHT